MNRKHQRGISLIEMLVAIGVMSVLMTAGYATIHESLKLHRQISKDAERLIARCGLVERLTGDFRSHSQIRSLGVHTWMITQQDGNGMEYQQQEDKMILRTLQNGVEKGHPKEFLTGPVRMLFRNRNTQTWNHGADTEPWEGKQDLAHLIFSDSEVIITREP